MRRAILVILGLLFTTSLCMAQRGRQIGQATQENTDEGLTIRHPSLTPGTRALVKNLANEVEIEVGIAGRIGNSATRIADLSPETAMALDIGSGGPIELNPIPRTRVRPDPPPPPPPPEPEPEPEPIIIVEAPPPPPPEPPPEPPPSPPPSPPPKQQPVNITIYNYITPPDPPPPSPSPPPEPKPSSSDLDNLAWLSMLALESRKDPPPPPLPEPPPPLPPPPPPLPEPPPPPPPPVPVPVPVPQYVPQPYYVPVPQYVPQPYYPLPFINEVQVIPGFPDPNNGRIYKLQVGSFYSEAGAALAYQQLVSAGFNAAWEHSHNAYRVFTVGIPASSVYATIYRLGSMGFRQIWVRE